MSNLDDKLQQISSPFVETARKSKYEAVSSGIDAATDYIQTRTKIKQQTALNNITNQIISQNPRTPEDIDRLLEGAQAGLPAHINNMQFNLQVMGLSQSLKSGLVKENQETSLKNLQVDLEEYRRSEINSLIIKEEFDPETINQTLAKINDANIAGLKGLGYTDSDIKETLSKTKSTTLAQIGSNIKTPEGIDEFLSTYKNDLDPNDVTRLNNAKSQKIQGEKVATAKQREVAREAALMGEDIIGSPELQAEFNPIKDFSISLDLKNLDPDTINTLMPYANPYERVILEEAKALFNKRLKEDPLLTLSSRGINVEAHPEDPDQRDLLTRLKEDSITFSPETFVQSFLQVSEDIELAEEYFDSGFKINNLFRPDQKEDFKKWFEELSSTQQYSYINDLYQNGVTAKKLSETLSLNDNIMRTVIDNDSYGGNKLESNYITATGLRSTDKGLISDMEAGVEAFLGTKNVADDLYDGLVYIAYNHAIADQRIIDPKESVKTKYVKLDKYFRQESINGIKLILNKNNPDIESNLLNNLSQYTGDISDDNVPHLYSEDLNPMQLDQASGLNKFCKTNGFFPVQISIGQIQFLYKTTDGRIVPVFDAKGNAATFDLR